MRDADTPAPAQPPTPIAPTRPSEEIARLGDEIYERDIRARVEADHHGKIVAIDVDSKDYAIGDGIIEASDRLRATRPDAHVRFVRVGYRAVHRFGMALMDGQDLHVRVTDGGLVVIRPTE